MVPDKHNNQWEYKMMNVQKAPKGNGRGMFSANKNSKPAPRKGSSLPSGGESKDSSKAQGMARAQATAENLRGEMA